MTVLELINALKDLGEENYNKEIVMFDGPSYYTPWKVEPMEVKDWGKKFKNKILLD